MPRIYVAGVALIGMLLFFGCRTEQTAKVMDPMAANRVGSHAAGAETFDPLVQSATGQMLQQLQNSINQVSYNPDDIQTRPGKKRICFLGVENETSEELGDFREHIYETIDTAFTQSGTCTCVSRWAVDGALTDLRYRPNELFDPAKRAQFSQRLGNAGQPFDYMVLARITSGTTIANRDSQKNYKLVLECINVNTGDKVAKTEADLRKEYNNSFKAKASSSKANPFNWGK